MKMVRYLFFSSACLLSSVALHAVESDLVHAGPCYVPQTSPYCPCGCGCWAPCNCGCTQGQPCTCHRR